MRETAERVADLGEDRLLARIARVLGPVPSDILGIGDDAALIPGCSNPTLLTTDVLVEGTHFRREWSLPEEVGAKALAVNLSDAAAMGGRPRFALVSLILPPETRVDSVLSLYRGLRRVARTGNTAVVGGNLARGKPFSITVTLVGDFPEGSPVLRSGARPGDRLFVTGTPGLARAGWLLCRRMPSARRGSRRGASLSSRDPWSTAGRTQLRERRRRAIAGIPGAAPALGRFLAPTARVDAAAALVALGPTALIDLSDGLARDLPRLARASRVGMIVDTGRLPASKAFRRLCETLGKVPEQMMLEGGEDYELAFTLPSRSQEVPRELGGVPVTQIGEITPEKGVRLCDAVGGLRPLALRGFDHFKRG